MGQSSPWRALFGLLGPHRVRAGAMSGVLTVAGSLPLLGPVLIGRFIDDAGAGATTEHLVFLAGLYIAVGLCRQLMAVAVAWTAADLAWTVTNDLRSDLARHVLALDLGFHRGTSPGELVSRVDGDVTALSEFIASFVVKAVSAMVTLVGIIVVVTWQDWRIGAGLAAYLALAIGTVFGMRNRAVDDAASERAATGRMLGEVEERLTGADDLRGNGGGSHAVATFQKASAAVLRSTLQREKQSVTLWVVSNAVFAFGGLIVLAVDAALLRRGAITLGTAYMIFQYTQILREPLGQLADETEAVQRAAGGMTRTIDLMAERSSIDNSGTAVLPEGPLSLHLDHVSFSYDDEDDPVPVLNAVSLNLAAGTTLGVLGRTGSGKTTLARLLLRLVDPTDGKVSFGGVDISSVPLSDLRARTGVVSQDVHLFAASIRDNLVLFDDSISNERVRAALEQLHLLDWVEAMPGGLETVLGPAGAGLSAGEGQLIALTRLFLREPDLVLLDEASSRVDPVTEARVTQAVDRLIEGRTAIVIAHRLSTVERLDEILILDAGGVAEHGTQDQLRATPSSRYAALLAVGSDHEVDAALLGPAATNISGL
ncbi:MAG: ABC transporter ATP-binding protein [Acidimicrobiales bacterium]|nr:ABC transporter ATP-binding protein [Acidimicrobiales bacterium]MDG2218283.1 ABC transporter ATP-binding protein [Acidimicrobiales bacterium]